MAVIIQDMSAEVAEPVPRPAQPHDAAGSAGGSEMTMERLRAAMLRDAQRQARLWAD
jgi:hypothetical protein